MSSAPTALLRTNLVRVRVQWSGFVRKAGVHDAGNLAETIAAVRAFVEAPLAAAATGVPALARGERAWVRE